MVIFKIVVFSSVVITILLGAYLVELIGRTGYLYHPTSIGWDVIVGFHVISLAVISAFILALINKTVSRAILTVLLVLILLVEGFFTTLNVSGSVWCGGKGMHQNLAEYIDVLLK